VDVTAQKDASAQSMSVPSLPRSVGELRRFAVASSRDQGFTGDGDALALLVSEVATNALLHGRGEVRLSVLWRAGRLRVEVADGSDRQPQRREAGLDAQGGRGLALLEELSDSWGVQALPERGKVVWFELTA
jgi:anti-sigma regulatory factor (Ser/Thr protein kinase)